MGVGEMAPIRGLGMSRPTEGGGGVVDTSPRPPGSVSLLPCGLGTDEATLLKLPTTYCTPKWWLKFLVCGI